jgi:hypothetical protein
MDDVAANGLRRVLLTGVPATKGAAGEMALRARFKTAVALVFGLVLFLIGTQRDAQAQTVQANVAQLTQAQAEAAVQRPLVPSLSPSGVVNGQVVASPNDSDLGVQEVLKRTEEYLPFTASVACPIYYTSNVALTNSAVRGDLITAPAAAVYYQPRITGTLYGLLDVRQQFFYYNRYNVFDFGSMDVEAGLSYVLPQYHGLILHASYDFNRLTYSDRVLDEFYQNNSILLDAQVPFRVCRAAQITLGADTNLSVAADHQSPRRNDYEAYAGYSVFLTRSLSLDGFGRLVVRQYHQNDRTDVSEILSASANLQLTNWWTVSAIGTFAHSGSNHDVYDYNVANIGGALALTAHF